MQFIESSSTDPAFNLAMEQYVFDQLPRGQDYFMLWQNHNAVIIGKHQNTAEEINLPYVRKHQIRVIRRLSGGGAVYHDLGNINYTFIANAGNIEKINLQMFCEPVVNLLNDLGVPARITGRNDITINGQKFSGNSQYIKDGRIMHHGTLMFDSDLSAVADALKVSADKIASKGFKSVRSRMTNIRPYLSENMTLEAFKNILKTRLLTGVELKPQNLSKKDLACIEKIKKERYDTWEWNFGYSPEYSVRKTRRIDGVGKLEVFLDVKQGRIRTFDTRGDYFGEGAALGLQKVLQGCPLEEQALKDALKGLDISRYYSGLQTEEFVSVLIS